MSKAVIQGCYYSQWEPIPNGEFETVDEALEAMLELQNSLGWRNLRVVSDGDVVEYGLPFEEDNHE